MCKGVHVHILKSLSRLVELTTTNIKLVIKEIIYVIISRRRYFQNFKMDEAKHKQVRIVRLFVINKYYTPSMSSLLTCMNLVITQTLSHIASTTKVFKNMYTLTNRKITFQLIHKIKSIKTSLVIVQQFSFKS